VVAEEASRGRGHKFEPRQPRIVATLHEKMCDLVTGEPRQPRSVATLREKYADLVTGWWVPPLIFLLFVSSQFRKFSTVVSLLAARHPPECWQVPARARQHKGVLAARTNHFWCSDWLYPVDP
jgi:hypothetical protein